jgi:hypothetical protein
MTVSAFFLLSALLLGASSPATGPQVLVGQTLNEFGGVDDYFPCGGCAEPGPGDNLDLIAMGSDPEAPGSQARAIFLVNVETQTIMGAVEVPSAATGVSMDCEGPALPPGSVVAAGVARRGQDDARLGSLLAAWRVERDGRFTPVATAGIRCQTAMQP